MTLRVVHISDVHVARQPEQNAEADVDYLRSYLTRVLPVAGAVGGASVLARYAWNKLDDKEFRKKYASMLEQLRSAGEKVDVRMVMGLVVGLLGASVGLAFFYRRELMKLLSVLQYRERREIRELLIQSLEEQSPDVVLITGDLTTVASEREFEEARSFVDRIRDLSGRPLVLILPGNHDVEDAKRGEKHTRLDTFARTFCDYLPRTIVPMKADLGDVVLLGVNSNTVGRGLGTDGRVSSRTMRFLENETKAGGRSGCLLGIHHHLAKMGHEPRVPRLENAEEVLNLALEGGVPLICHGHKHEFYDWVYTGKEDVNEDQIAAKAKRMKGKRKDRRGKDKPTGQDETAEEAACLESAGLGTGEGEVIRLGAGSGEGGGLPEDVAREKAGLPPRDALPGVRVSCAGSSTAATIWKPDRIRYRIYTFDSGQLLDPRGKLVERTFDLKELTKKKDDEPQEGEVSISSAKPSGPAGAEGGQVEETQESL